MKALRLLSGWFAPIAACFGILAGRQQALAQRALGTDVSNHQGGGINWATVRSDGVGFAWTKCTEGTGFFDADFTINEGNAKAAGVFIGAYHYARPDLNLGLAGADAEADYFWSKAGTYIKTNSSYLVPMLDWEAPGIVTNYNKTTASQWANEWCNRVVADAAAAGVTLRPVLYTFTSYATSWTDRTVTQWPLWMASYPSNPNPQTGTPSGFSPWSRWQMWQYADTNWSGGDADVFNGTLSTFASTFLIGSNPPTNALVNTGSNITFRITTGLAPTVHYQWAFNGTPIAGATGTSYTVTNAQTSNAGPYTVTYTNSITPVLTGIASLGVVAPLPNAPGAILAPANMADWWPGSGNGNDIFGNFDCTPFFNVSYANGEQDLAFHFDGTSSYLSNSAPSLAVPWTISMWVNRQNAPGTGATLLGDGTQELKLEQYNGTRQVGYTKFGVNDYIFSPAYTVPAGVWTHLTFVGTSGGTTLYVNGAPHSSLTNTFSLPRAYIGAGWVTSSGDFVDYMLGSLDEIMVFNRALTSTEIQKIYNAGSAGLVRAPEITGASVTASGQFQLYLKGMTAKTYTIYSSSNLTSWTSLGTLSNPNGTNTFTDGSAMSDQKYYRVLQSQ